jgi:meiosis-specific protein HOP1
MTLGEDLPRLKAGDLKDPVSEAVKKGRVPTLRDVKKSVKVPASFMF